MKIHRILTVLVAAFLALPAQAGPLYRAGSGTGGAVIVPFWTVDGLQDSLLTISNDGDRPSAVRVRVLDEVGDLLLALGVYLDRDDQWTTAFTAFGAQADMLSADASCVVLEDGSGFFGDGTNASILATLPTAFPGTGVSGPSRVLAQCAGR